MLDIDVRALDCPFEEGEVLQPVRMNVPTRIAHGVINDVVFVCESALRSQRVGVNFRTR